MRLSFTNKYNQQTIEMVSLYTIRVSISRFVLDEPDSVMTSCFVWHQILLLCHFIRYWFLGKGVLGFCKTDKQQLRVTMYCHWRCWRIKLWRTCNISLVQLRLFIGEERERVFAFTRKRLERGGTKNQICLHNKEFPRNWMSFKVRKRIS